MTDLMRMLSEQTFRLPDLGTVAFLVILEALLSADNALVLAIMVRHLPKDQQQRALLYGLGGAFVFRLVAILLVTTIIRFWWLQAVGAIYLLALPIRHFLHASSRGPKRRSGGGFWPTILAVEFTDIAFAIDSVLAGVATVGNRSDKIWVVFLGAIIGVVLLRFAAGAFIKLLERYPRFDHVAYLLVGWVGVKLSFLAIHNYGKVSGSWNISELSLPVFWGVLLSIAFIGGIYALGHRSTPTEISELADEVQDAADLSIDEPSVKTPDRARD